MEISILVFKLPETIHETIQFIITATLLVYYIQWSHFVLNISRYLSHYVLRAHSKTSFLRGSTESMPSFWSFYERSEFDTATNGINGCAFSLLVDQYNHCRIIRLIKQINKQYEKNGVSCFRTQVRHTLNNHQFDQLILAMTIPIDAESNSISISIFIVKITIFFVFS